MDRPGVERARFVSFDGGTTEEAEYQRPDRYRMIEAALGDRPRIARGGGYSYAPASFGGGSLVQDVTRFNRVLRFERDDCLIEVEAGMTLGDLLKLTAPAGLWLPVQPGYPCITVGGCIATNVHGKNPASNGTFIHWLEGLTLFHPKHGTIRVSRISDPGVFELTCGGYGLSGIILTATLRLRPLPGPVVRVRRIPVGTLADGLAHLRRTNGAGAFCYTWHDATPRAQTLGRGLVYEGEFVSGAPERAAAIAPYRVLTPSGRARLPMSLWGRVTAPVFNSLFRLWETSGPDSGEIQLFDSLFPFARRSHYLWMFGRRGLAEYQVLVPDAHADDFLASLRTQIIATRASAVLISMKLFRGTAKLLRFDGDGVCVTLNLTRSAAGLKFLSVVDDLTVAAGGVPNIVKDSRLPLSIVRACYPEYQDFRDRLHAYDPMRLFRSALSERLDL